MKEQIKKIISDVSGANADGFSVDASNNSSHGDYSSNVALILAKNSNKNPLEVANNIISNINSSLIRANKTIEENGLFKKIEVAGPGFINFFMADKFFIENLKKIDKNYGKNSELKNKKIIIDYTDPNPFKDFHIGHLMNNAIGESLSRIFEFQGAKAKRVCYQGDVGMHVAKAVYGKIHNKSLEWSQAYAYGAQKYETDETARSQIQGLNRKIYQRSDKTINRLYDQGKKESLKRFDKIYKKLGTKFDWLIFESQVGPIGKKIVLDNLNKVFERGEKGAIIFKGEKHGLHTRVFINSEGLPTYEAKDLGLAKLKYKKYKYDVSVVVTANEINEYFKVMLKALEQIDPDLAKKTKHIGHGMLRLPEGKMSSRTGNVITAESLINKVQQLVKEKNRNEKVSQSVAMASIRYSVLKQSIGSDIIYDFDKSVSFEGDSGPYLQYSYARAMSVLEKAKREGVKASFKYIPEQISQLEKKMCQFSEAVWEAGKKYEPHYILLYLTELAAIFNSYYAENKIVDKKEKISSYRVVLTAAFARVMKNGMWLLGIETLNRM